MAGSAARFGGGFLALAAIWIGVYWSWEPSRTAGVSFADPTEEPKPRDATPPRVEPIPEHTATPEPVPLAPEAGGATTTVEGVVPPEFRDYTIRRGDTFESISRSFYGTTHHAKAIAAANPFANPTTLRAGQVIRVPVDPDNVQGSAPEGAAPDLPEPEFLEYVVVKNDTLSEIAQHFYGSLRYADVIFNANRETMRSMDDLHIGDVLRIPSRESVLGKERDR